MNRIIKHKFQETLIKYTLILSLVEKNEIKQGFLTFELPCSLCTPADYECSNCIIVKVFGNSCNAASSEWNVIKGLFEKIDKHKNDSESPNLKRRLISVIKRVIRLLRAYYHHGE